MGRTPSIVKSDKATCHPGRKNYRDGICRECYGARKLPSSEFKLPKSLASLSKAERTELQELHRQAQILEEQAQLAGAYLQYHLPVYAKAHVEGALVAAAKGDTKPAEWALSHVKPPKGGSPVVEPPAKAPAESGIKVFVGVKVGALTGIQGASEHVVQISDADMSPIDAETGLIE